MLYVSHTLPLGTSAQTDLPQAVASPHASPIQRIPVEIVQKIFLSCLPRDEYTRPDPRYAPLLLNQICSGWRNIALSTPRLWSSLWIQLSRRNVGRRLNTMMTWLHRSAGCALSLHAQVQSTGLENVPLFFEFLDAYRLRWRDLRLVLPFSWARVAIHILDRPTPLLEVLRMRVAKSHDNLLPVPEISFLLTDISAPHLRYLCWGITGPNRVRFLPQLSRLEDLDVDYEISVTECLDILQQCLGLVSCEFWRIKIVQSDAAKLNSRCIITHPRLRSFSLHSTVVTDLLLEYLTLPALIKLKVAVIRDTSTQIPNTWSQPRFNSFFARSAPPLQHLILQDALPSEEALIQCLECVSVSLIELIVLDTDGIFVMRDGVLALLTVRQDGDGHATCLCPRLEALRFGRSLLSTDGLLADMVESRWRRTWPDTIARLRSINPCISITDHPNDVRRLTTLRDKGLHWS